MVRDDHRDALVRVSEIGTTIENIKEPKMMIIIILKKKKAMNTFNDNIFSFDWTYQLLGIRGSNPFCFA